MHKKGKKMHGMASRNARMTASRGLNVGMCVCMCVCVDTKKMETRIATSQQNSYSRGGTMALLRLMSDNHLSFEIIG